MTRVLAVSLLISPSAIRWSESVISDTASRTWVWRPLMSYFTLPTINANDEPFVHKRFFQYLFCMTAKFTQLQLIVSPVQKEYDWWQWIHNFHIIGFRYFYYIQIKIYNWVCRSFSEKILEYYFAASLYTEHLFVEILLWNCNII